MNSCSKCLLNETIPRVAITPDGECNFCKNHKPWKGHDEALLLNIFSKAKKKGRVYDALVPLSGGKDSTYVLYLAVKKYGLRVLAYTYDNGFMSGLAKENIEQSVKVCGVDHIWVMPDIEFIRSLYRASLLHSGEICGICGVGIERNMLKISEAWKIPLILLGHTPTESNSFTGEDLYDPERLKAVLKQEPAITKDMVGRFLIYPNLNFIKSFLYSRSGRFGKKVNVLYYGDLPTDRQIGETIKKEMDWKDASFSEYTRHFDCLAEPFTNYIREKRFGFSRRLPQLSNMIRNNELSREEALRIINKDHNNALPENYEYIKESLKLTEEEVKKAFSVPVNIFNDRASKANLLFAKVRKLVKGDEG